MVRALALILGYLTAVVVVGTSTATAELLAGAARRDVTPPTGGALYGYGARGSNVSTGVHDPLFAKATRSWPS